MEDAVKLYHCPVFFSGQSSMRAPCEGLLQIQGQDNAVSQKERLRRPVGLTGDSGRVVGRLKQKLCCRAVHETLVLGLEEQKER